MSPSLFDRLRQLRDLCPELRVAQLMAILGDLGAEATGRNLGDLDDDQFAAAIDRFGYDIARSLGRQWTPAR